MDDLARWTGEQLDEDERIARATHSVFLSWEYDESVRQVRDLGNGNELANVLPRHAYGEHIAEHDPARALREIEAKRELLDEHQDVNDGYCGTCVEGEWGYPTHGGSSAQRFPCRTLRLLATVYRDRPGYRAGEWAL
ncbi:DUF6221 family protein [Streptomyces sp. NPDC055109]